MKIQAFRLLCLSILLGLAKAAISYEVVEEGEIQGRSFQKYRAFHDKQPVSIRKWADGLQQEGGDFAAGLTTILRQAPFQAFYWEVRPAMLATLDDEDLEFVLVDAPALAKRNARFRSFEQPCAQSTSVTNNVDEDNNNNNNATACVFANLSGDATLVVPKPLAQSTTTYDEVYTHLAKFVRNGAPHQVKELWKTVGRTLLQQTLAHQAANETVWLSTAGNGVPWLHIRLDSRPKYYRYAPYRVSVVSMEDESEL